jgi:hypothetical protein
MKALLIVAALNMQLVYDDMAVCKTAQSELKTQQHRQHMHTQRRRCQVT